MRALGLRPPSAQRGPVGIGHRRRVVDQLLAERGCVRGQGEHLIPVAGQPAVGAQQQHCLDRRGDRAALAAVLDCTPQGSR